MNIVKALFSRFWRRWLTPVLTGLTRELLEDAYHAVVNQEERNPPPPNGNKFQTAESQLKQRWPEIRDHLISLAIELAVRRLKEELE